MLKHLAILLAISPLAVAADRPAKGGGLSLETHVQPLLKEFCVDCHNPMKKKGDVDLTELIKNPKIEENHEEWEKIAELITTREMPPEKKPQPSDAQRDQIVHFIESRLTQVDCKLEQNPGKVTIRRLNKEEYRNTIRDLLGVNYSTDEFPNDEVGYGFDNIGDVLSLSPLLMEKFLAAAEEVVRKAIVVDAAPKAFLKKLRGEEFKSSSDWVKPLDSRVLGLYREGEASAELKAPTKGEYVFRVRAHAELAGPEAPKLALRVDGREVAVFEVKATDKAGNVYEARTSLSSGQRKITLAFLNNYNDGGNPDEKQRGDRNVFVNGVEIEGPPGPAPGLPESHKRLIPRMPEPGQERALAIEVLRDFATRAYRRPVEQAEVERLAGFVELAIKNGGSFLEGMQIAVQAALCSPHFLFRWELDPAALPAGSVRDLGDYEVASRLSYFLWSSMPDAELFRLAAEGKLRRDGNLEKQVARMVQDWKSRAFVDNFAGQWLQIRNIWEVGIDPDVFPKWKDSLRGLMKEETVRFFEAVLKENRPITELLDADFTYLNEQLARYYGIGGVKGDAFQRVQLPPGSPRGGVLTQGSVLVSTSTPTRTSPVIRGKWILEQILGTHPPPPPPDVPPLQEQRTVNQSASLRQRFEQHRNNPDCMGCHSKMDPLGFALENFDATGAWRENDGKFPIDASGELTNGTKFRGPAELKKVLKQNKNFARSLARNLMVYALGRGLEYPDKCAVDEAVEAVNQAGGSFQALLTAIATSDPFLKRKTELAQQ